LEFNIVIDAKLSEETKKNLEELKSASDEDKVREGMLGLEKKQDVLPKIEPEDVQDQLGEAMEVGKDGMKNMASFAKNPGGMVKGLMTKLLGAGAMAGPLAIAIAAPIVMVEMIKLMSVKGGPLNRDWRRFIDSEVAVGLSREQQLEDRFGVSQTILTQIRGFAPNNENWTYNNLFDINDQRIARIGMSDREAGVVFFTP